MLGLGTEVLAVGESVVGTTLGAVAVELPVFDGSELFIVGAPVPLGSVEPELELGPSSSESPESSESSSDLAVDASSPFLLPLSDAFVG